MRLQPCFDRFKDNRKHWNGYDRNHYIAEIILHKGQIAKEISQEQENCHPRDRPKNIIYKKAAIILLHELLKRAEPTGR